MKKLFLICCFFLSGCAVWPKTENLSFGIIDAQPFQIASWSKITRKGAPLHIYVEGDGFSWKNNHTPSLNPTPKKQMLLTIADKDTAENVVYLARPCQYVHSSACDVPYWTYARFAPEIIDAMYNGVMFFVRESQTEKIYLTGYSGGAVVTGFLAVHLNKPVFWTTIAGVLDHEAWTKYHNDTPLSNSVSLKPYVKQLETIPQRHYVGEKDKNVPFALTQDFIDLYDDKSRTKIVFVPHASHNEGWNGFVLEN